MKNLLITLLLMIPLLQLNAQCYELVWQDEFDGAAIDGAKWSYQNGGWNGSNVQNCYDPANATVSNGSLFIASKYEPGFDCFGTPVDFTSGFIQTKNRIDWTFGRFEARVKLAASNSTWPAFWMSPQNSVYGSWPQSGEIDIFEVKGHDMSKSYGNAHWGNSPGDKQQEKKTYNFPAGNGADNWHVYAVEWQLGQLDFYIDGNHYGTINDFDEPNATTHPGPFDIGFYLRLNVAVGGNYLTAPWNDANNGINQLPAAMEVDWVRVYQDLGNCPPAECQLVENGNFDNDMNAWSLFEYGSATGNLSLTGNGYAKIDVINPGTSSWHLALRQTGLFLETGKTYQISMKAYADAVRSCPIIIHKTDGSQYAYTGQSLTTSPTVYQYQFTMNDATDVNAVFSLNAGNDSPDVYVDNISITEVAAGTVCDDGDACTGNDVYDNACNCEGVYEDADADGYCIGEDPDDNDVCNPDLCDLGNCETLQNWNFDNGTADWSIFEYGVADGNLSIQPNGTAKIDVLTAGTTDWHLALRQTGLLLETGKTYKIRLKAYADAARSASIIMSKQDGTQYANLAQAFTTTPTVYESQFTVNDVTNPNAVFNLNVGSSTIDVYVSDVSLSEVFCDNEQGFISCDLDVFLEGTYDAVTGLMRSQLQEYGLLPMEQPYNTLPWNYAGTENVAAHPAGAVDWVLVSFRESLTADTEVERVAATVLEDGSIFPNIEISALNGINSLYIVIEHRNHLPVMSAQAVNIIDNVLTYDFRNTEGYALAVGAGQKQVGNNWCMFAGNVDHSNPLGHDISGADIGAWQSENGLFNDYIDSDFNLDGDVNGGDKSKWRPNNGISSSVPR